MAFREVARLDDLWSGEMRGVVAAGRRVLLVHIEGEVRAFEDCCAHLGVALSEGALEGCVLTCRAHHWQYDARSGRGVNPAPARLRSYAVRIEDGAILVDLDAPAAEG